MAENLLNKIAREHYDNKADSGQDFNLDEIIEEVLADPALDSVTGELVEAAVTGAVAKVDKLRTQNDDDQGSLFGDNDQVVPLGGGRRKRKGSMVLDDVQIHLQLVTENEQAVVAAANRERQQAEMLTPYLRRGMTWDLSAEAWENDNPDFAA